MKPSTDIDRKQFHHRYVVDFKTVCSILAVFGVLFTPVVLSLRSASAGESPINCDPHKGACSQSLGDLTVTLEISPRPVRAMRDLVFTVTISGGFPSKPPSIDLGMPAMKMGPNRVLLKRTGDGSFEGKGVIVRCPSGRRTWFANVTLPGSGVVTFVFDVVY